jgi:hypothetical protein
MLQEIPPCHVPLRAATTPLPKRISSAVPITSAPKMLTTLSLHLEDRTPLVAAPYWTAYDIVKRRLVVFSCSAADHKPA